MLRATSITSDSRVNSSTMFSSFSARPSAVWSNWKSNAHTWLGRSARSRSAGTVDSPSRRRLRLRCGHPQPLLAPQALHTLAVHLPAQLPQMMMRTAVPPPWTLLRELPQLCAQRRVILRALRLVALRGAMLPDDPACPALADAETVAKHRDRPAPADRAYQFPREISFNARFSSA